MKFSKILIAGLTLLVLFPSCCRHAAKNDITVVSFNIRLSSGPDGENSWAFRRGATIAMLDSLKPDLMGLQEACCDQLEYIETNCPEYGWYGLGRDDGKSRGEHMAIFYRKESFELLDSATFWLSETPHEPSRGWDAACRRTATYARLRHRPTGREVHYVNTHLDHMGLQAQEKGLQLIVDVLDSLTHGSDAPVILTGDFNVIPSNPALKVVNARLLSARTTAAVTDTLASFNAWRKPLSGAALGDNLKVEKTPLTIDYIYYRGFGDCSSFETVTATFASVPFISDHYPVKAVLSF